MEVLLSLLLLLFIIIYNLILFIKKRIRRAMVTKNLNSNLLNPNNIVNIYSKPFYTNKLIFIFKFEERIHKDNHELERLGVLVISPKINPTTYVPMLYFSGCLGSELAIKGEYFALSEELSSYAQTYQIWSKEIKGMFFPLDAEVIQNIVTEDLKSTSIHLNSETPITLKGSTIIRHLKKGYLYKDCIADKIRFNTYAEQEKRKQEDKPNATAKTTIAEKEIKLAQKNNEATPIKQELKTKNQTNIQPPRATKPLILKKEIHLSDLCNEKEILTLKGKQLIINGNHTSNRCKYFEKGQVIGSTTAVDDDTSSILLIAPDNGYYSLILDSYENKPNSLICYWYLDITDALKFGGNVVCETNYDEFSNNYNLTWELKDPHIEAYNYNLTRFDSLVEDSYKINNVFKIKLDLINNTPHICFIYNPQYIKLKQGDYITFLFIDNEKKDSTKFSITNQIYRKEKDENHINIPLYQDDLDNLCSKNMVGIRLIDQDFTQEYEELKHEFFYEFRRFCTIYKHILAIHNFKVPSIKEDLNFENEKSKFKDENCYVYLMIDTTNGFHKIGISNKPKYREHTLQSEKPTIELITAKKFPSRIIAESIESALHKSFADKRIRGEWFNLSPKEIEDVKESLK